MDTETAYLAGFFDGEGCISVGKDKAKRHYSLMVTVGQIDPRPLVRFHALFGGYILRKKDNRGFRSIHQWRCSAREGAAALGAMLPYLQVKHEEAELAIEFQSSYAKVFEKSPAGRDAQLVERERMYQSLRAMKHRSYDDFALPRADYLGPKVGGKSARLTAGPGTGHPNPRRGLVQDPERLASMHAMRREGKTYEAIGAAFGIKKAAAHHLLKRWPDG